jgi:VanZ family protein
MTMLAKLQANRYLYYWLPVLLWMGLIFVMSSRSNLPSLPNKTVDFTIKKAGHLTEYGVLAFLLWRAIARDRSSPAPVSFGGAFIISVLYAASDEFHQTFVLGREGRLTDIGFDALGVLLALGLVWWFSSTSTGLSTGE